MFSLNKTIFLALIAVFCISSVYTRSVGHGNSGNSSWKKNKGYKGSWKNKGNSGSWNNSWKNKVKKITHLVPPTKDHGILFYFNWECQHNYQYLYNCDVYGNCKDFIKCHGDSKCITFLDTCHRERTCTKYFEKNFFNVCNKKKCNFFATVADPAPVVVTTTLVQPVKTHGILYYFNWDCQHDYESLYNCDALGICKDFIKCHGNTECTTFINTCHREGTCTKYFEKDFFHVCNKTKCNFFADPAPVVIKKTKLIQPTKTHGILYYFNWDCKHDYESLYNCDALGICKDFINCNGSTTCTTFINSCHKLGTCTKYFEKNFFKVCSKKKCGHGHRRF